MSVVGGLICDIELMVQKHFFCKNFYSTTFIYLEKNTAEQEAKKAAAEEEKAANEGGDDEDEEHGSEDGSERGIYYK